MRTTGSAMGTANYMPSDKPVGVFGISNAATVAAGYDHTCAVLTGGTITLTVNSELAPLEYVPRLVAPFRVA